MERVAALDLRSIGVRGEIVRCLSRLGQVMRVVSAFEVDVWQKDSLASFT